jgi:hypothetical protein
MNELLTKLRDRAEARIRYEAELHGDDSPAVRMARLLLDDAEQLAAELADAWAPTAEAAARTGWGLETLQRYARVVTEDGPLPQLWQGLRVEQTPAGYLFLLASIPPNPRRASAA